MSTSTILILSGCTSLRLNAIVNHKVYADQFGYRYSFDNTPIPHLKKLCDTKLEILKRFVVPGQPEWIFWVDDDAYFTDFSKPLGSFLTNIPNTIDLIFCRSPKNKDNAWTWMSAGQFFIRNTKRSQQLIQAALDTDLTQVESWWDIDKFGLFLNSEQDCLVYLLNQDSHFQGMHQQRDYTEFNSRPHHYKQHLNEHFLTHFAGVGNKARAVEQFSQRMNSTPYLVPTDLLEPYQTWIQHSAFKPDTKVGLIQRLFKKTKKRHLIEYATDY